MSREAWARSSRVGSPFYPGRQLARLMSACKTPSPPASAFWATYMGKDGRLPGEKDHEGPRPLNFLRAFTLHLVARQRMIRVLGWQPPVSGQDWFEVPVRLVAAPSHDDPGRRVRGRPPWPFPWSGPSQATGSLFPFETKCDAVTRHQTWAQYICHAFGVLGPALQDKPACRGAFPCRSMSMHSLVNGHFVECRGSEHRALSILDGRVVSGPRPPENGEQTGHQSRE